MGLSLTELLQRLAASEEALRTDFDQPLDTTSEAQSDREALVQHQAELTRELRRRRFLRQRPGHEAERRPSAAWPPPPW
jgi:hypothetical protein